MGALLDARESEPGLSDEDRAEGRRVRRRALIGAFSAAALAVALFVSLKQYANSQTPQRPVPPHAAPAALQPSPQQGESPSAAAAPAGWSASSPHRRVVR
jgi:hypothetical protein